MALLVLTLASPARGQVGCGLPMMNSVEPSSGHPGELITAHGSNLGSDCVAVLYLTDGKSDTKVEMVEQTATVVKFKIPAEMKSGRLGLMVLTKGKDARLIEEPVKIVVETETTTD
jgi:hypothetical protein